MSRTQQRSAQYQQTQSEHAQRRRDGFKNSTVMINGTNCSLTSQPVPLGERNLCVGVFSIVNCDQYKFLLRKQLQEQIFMLARTIATDPNVPRDSDGNEQSDGRGVRAQYVRDCMSQEKLHALVEKLADLIFKNPNDARILSCNHITEYVESIRLNMRSSSITDEACHALQKEMTDQFLTCIDKASTDTTLLFLLLLLLLIPIVGGVAAFAGTNDSACSCSCSCSCLDRLSNCVTSCVTSLQNFFCPPRRAAEPAHNASVGNCLRPPAPPSDVP